MDGCPRHNSKSHDFCAVAVVAGIPGDRCDCSTSKIVVPLNSSASKERRTMEKITLYFKQGSSDKVYSASIEPEGSKFVVNFEYGRRGSTLATGTKTSTPVDYESAK